MPWKNQKSNMFEAVPAGNFPFALEEYVLKTTKPEKGSKLMYQASFKVLENDVDELQPYVGRVFSDWWVVGTDADPGAEEAETLNSGVNPGCAKIKRLAEATENEPDPDEDITIEGIDDILSAAVGTEFVGHITKKGPKGSEQNNINGYFKVGERQLGLDSPAKPNKKSGGAESGPKSIHAMKQAAQAKALVKAPLVEYEEEEDAPAPKKLNKAKVAVVVDDDEDAVPTPKAKKAGKPKDIQCPLDCGTPIPYDKLADHVAKCKGPSEEPVEEDDDE